MDSSDFDAILTNFECWNCHKRTETGLEVKLHQGPRNRTLQIGDPIKLGTRGDRVPAVYDIVLSDPSVPGTISAAHDWRCPACKQLNWVHVRIEDDLLTAVEPLFWDGDAAAEIHLVDAGAATTYVFRDAGMDCYIDPITLEVSARRNKGETSVQPYRQTLSSMLPGRFRTLLASARFHAQSAFSHEDYAHVFSYETPELRKDLANTARLYREHPDEFPRYLPAST